MYGKPSTNMNANNTTGLNELTPIGSNSQNTNERSHHDDSRDLHGLSPADLCHMDTFEESFEPECFEAMTPIATGAAPREAVHQFASCSTDQLTSPHQFTTSGREEHQNIQRELSEGHTKDDTLPTHSQSLHKQSNEGAMQNDETSGKRSTSQILALLGRSRGKFKPPAKAESSPGTFTSNGDTNVTHLQSREHRPEHDNKMKHATTVRNSIQTNSNVMKPVDSTSSMMPSLHTEGFDEEANSISNTPQDRFLEQNDATLENSADVHHSTSHAGMVFKT